MGIVILCNIIGTALASLFFLTTDLFTPDIDKALDELAHHVASFLQSRTCLKGLCRDF